MLILTQHDEVEFIGWGAWLVGLVCTILLEDFSTSVFEYLIGTGIWVLICLLLHWLALRNARNDEMSDKTDYRTFIMKTLFPFLLLLPILACANQQPTPEIRLVKDNADGFHLQWDEPLPAERIVLVEMTTVYDTSAEDARPVEQILKRVQVLHFPDGVFKSPYINLTLMRHSPEKSRFTIEILDVGDKNDQEKLTTQSMPHLVISCSDLKSCVEFAMDTIATRASLHGRGQVREEILNEHPFKPYTVGSPSILHFDVGKNPFIDLPLDLSILDSIPE